MSKDPLTAILSPRRGEEDLENEFLIGGI